MTFRTGFDSEKPDETLDRHQTVSRRCCVICLRKAEGFCQNRAGAERAVRRHLIIPFHPPRKSQLIMQH